MKTILNRFLFFLIGAGFMGFGIYVLNSTVIPTFRDWYKMKSWYPVQAQLIEVTGSSNSTHAIYQYRVNQNFYTGDRVYVAKFNDSIGRYHSQIQSRLNKSLEARQPIIVYHHPINPGQAVIDRDMRWGLFVMMTGFCLTFVFTGMAVGYAGLTHEPESVIRMPKTSDLKKEWEAKKKDTEYTEDFFDFLKFKKHQLKQKTKAASSTPPGRWQEKKEWQSPAIRSDAKSSYKTMWFFALTCLAVSSPVLFFFAEEWADGNYADFPIDRSFLTGQGCCPYQRIP